MKKCSNLLKFILFADDTNIFLSTKKGCDITEIMNIELVKLSRLYGLKLINYL